MFYLGGGLQEGQDTSGVYRSADVNRVSAILRGLDVLENTRQGNVRAPVHDNPERTFFLVELQKQDDGPGEIRIAQTAARNQKLTRLEFRATHHRRKKQTGQQCKPEHLHTLNQRRILHSATFAHGLQSIPPAEPLQLMY